MILQLLNRNWYKACTTFEPSSGEMNNPKYSSISLETAQHRVVLSNYFANGLMSTVLSVVLQAFYTIYTAVLLYLTQSLALTRDLSRPQLLTAIHDTSGAWSGIGAAMLFLWRQTKVTASLGKVLAVATYLLNTMILHITSSSILQFQTYNTTTIETTPSTLSWPNSTDYTRVDWGPNRGVGNVN
ncbi:hypothetical protein BU15DRAFT_65594, partial [Melanogaster broomeanus]